MKVSGICQIAHSGITITVVTGANHCRSIGGMIVIHICHSSRGLNNRQIINVRLVVVAIAFSLIGDLLTAGLASAVVIILHL